MKTFAEIGELTSTLLANSRFNPLFKSGWGRYNPLLSAEAVVDVDPTKNSGPSWILDLYSSDSLGSQTAADTTKRHQLLAEAIPALSLPLGANPSAEVENYNLPAEAVVDTRWPSTRGMKDGLPRWNHSDMREVAFIYTYTLFNQVKTISETTP